MNYRTILFVIASVVALIAVTFIMYKQSVGNTPYSSIVESGSFFETQRQV